MHVRGALAATATPGHRRCTMTAPQMPHELALVPRTRWFQAPVWVTTVPWEPVCVPGTFQEPGGATRPGTVIANEYEAQRRHRIRRPVAPRY
eukprot:COSAG02_NODE_20151_length_846_cov_1.145917_1_plen_92_part_00